MKPFAILLSCIILSCLFQNCTSSGLLPDDKVGTYYGFLPCADCPGIGYTLDLTKEGHYSLTMDYNDRDSIFESDGTYTYKNNQLNLLDEAGKITGRYEFDGEQLIYLDAEGKRITFEIVG